MSLPKKLVVTTENETIFLSGIMDDGMSTYGLKEALKGVFASIDLGKVKSASWNSLLRFNETVRGTGAPCVALDNVPYSIYRFLRMTDKFDDFYQVNTLEAPLYEEASRTLTLAKFNCGGSETKAIRSGTAPKSQRLFGRLQHFQALFGSPESQKIWDASELSDVILDYVLFCEIIFALVFDIARSVETSIGGSIREFEAQASSIERAVTAVSLGADCQKIISDINALIAEVKPIIATKSVLIMDAIAPCQTVLNEIAIEALSCLAQNKPLPLPILDKVVNVIRSLLPVEKMAEDFGVVIGQLYAVYELKKVEKPYLAALSGRVMDADEIQNVIDIYCIMDPMADDQEYLLEAIGAYFHEIDNEIAKISTISQGCDLVCQIVEHRIKETQIIQNFYNGAIKGNPEAKPEGIAEFRKELMDLIKKRMVTDQEKFAMKFFMPEESVVEKSAAQPGDMMLF